MAQTVAVVRATLTDTLAGTTDFTKTGFGTPDAAIIVLDNSNGTNNPQTDGRMSVGFWSGTDQRVATIFNVNNTGTTITYRQSENSYGAMLTGDATTVAAYSVTSTTDGIRLTMDVDATTVGRFCTVILFKGVSAKVLDFTPNATQNSTQESASLGFAPKLLFFTCIGAAAGDAANVGSVLSFGFAANDGTHGMIGHANTDAAAAADLGLYMSDTYCAGQVTSSAVTWTIEVSTWGADTFTATTRLGATGSDGVAVLALGGDVSFDCGSFATLTGAGDSVISTSIAPDAVVIGLCSALAQDTLYSNSTANGAMMIGLADDDGEFSHNISSQDAADPTSEASRSTATNVISLDTRTGGSAVLMSAATVALNSADFTLTYTTVDASARQGWWVALGNASGGGGNPQFYPRIAGGFADPFPRRLVA